MKYGLYFFIMLLITVFFLSCKSSRKSTERIVENSTETVTSRSDTSTHKISTSSRENSKFVSENSFEDYGRVKYCYDDSGRLASIDYLFKGSSSDRNEFNNNKADTATEISNKKTAEVDKNIDIKKKTDIKEEKTTSFNPLSYIITIALVLFFIMIFRKRIISLIKSWIQ